MKTGTTGRSTMPRPEARRRYVELGEFAVLEQIRKDARLVDGGQMAVGPFSRLSADEVAARDGKTRGAITNLFGSQASFQAETMALALDAASWIAGIEYPDPDGFPTAEAWIEAFCDAQSARGPRHGARPQVSYAFLWALWLSTVPYGLWSEEISRPSMEEQRLWVGDLEALFARVLERFGLRMRPGTTVGDLAAATASMVEGVWLNQCLTTRHPLDAAEPIATALRRAGLMLWRGATERAG
jgi:AcrR family transcriptional regulator